MSSIVTKRNQLLKEADALYARLTELTEALVQGGKTVYQPLGSRGRFQLQADAPFRITDKDIYNFLAETGLRLVGRYYKGGPGTPMVQIIFEIPNRLPREPEAQYHFKLGYDEAY